MTTHDEPSNERTRGVELLISTVLRAGVMTSFVLVVAGSIITFARAPALMRSPEALSHLRAPGAAVRHSLHEIMSGLARLDGPAIIMTGLLLLIATPVLRVAASIMIFLYERDLAFVVITTVVLLLLLLSFLLGSTTG